MYGDGSTVGLHACLTQISLIFLRERGSFIVVWNGVRKNSGAKARRLVIVNAALERIRRQGSLVCHGEMALNGIETQRLVGLSL